MNSPASKIKTFIIAFLSAALFFVGAGTLAMLFIPPAITWLQTADYRFQPQLPIAEARTQPFITLDELPATQLYPPAAALVPAPAPAEPHTVGWIRIPALDITVPLAQSPTIEDADIIDTLVYGAALYPNGIAPGHLGNTFIAAHSTGEPWKGKYRFAFLRINELRPGNEILLDVGSTRYTYRIVAKDLVKPSADFRVESGRPKPTVTLMACWPLWTTNQRMLITAELTNITKLSVRPL